MPRFWEASCALLLACGCAHGVDVTKERKALIDADTQFARDTAQRGVEGWVSWFTEDGTMYPAARDPIQGRRAIREEMDDLHDPRSGRGGVHLEWQPVRAEVSESGELGWTTGTSRLMTARGMRQGRYITVWRKQADGNWKVWADLGNLGQLDPASPQRPPG
jgi:ketosteroid isomerase-like protein